jgi:hypothetical protein
MWQQSAPPKGPVYTKDNYIRHAAAEIDHWENKNKTQISALAKQTIVDNYWQRTGEASNIGVDHRQRGINMANKRSGIKNYAAGLGESLGTLGSDTVSLFNPEAGAGMAKRNAQYYGENQGGVSGKIGQLTGELAKMIPMLASGGAGAFGAASKTGLQMTAGRTMAVGAAQYAITGMGSGRAEVRSERLLYPERNISGWQEFGHAILTGALEGGSAYVGAAIGKAGGKLMASMAPEVKVAAAKGGEMAGAKLATKKLLNWAKLGGYEISEEVATQMGQNFSARIMEVDPERDLMEGTAEVARDTALLFPLMSVVGGGRGGRRLVGSMEEAGLKAGLQRPPGRGNVEVQANATDFMKTKGAKRRVMDYSPVDEDRAVRIAAAYETAQHNPNDPMTKAAYAKLKNETKEQYEDLQRRGVVFEHQATDPYANSAEMMADVRDNNRLKVLQTDMTQMPQDHPLAEVDPVHGITFNDMFAAVHQYYGHAGDGATNGPRGEEHAWRNHSQMYSKQARRAMTTETRGRNSTVNFGTDSDFNAQNPGNPIYPDQKAVLLDEKYSDLDPLTDAEEAMKTFEQDTLAETDPNSTTFNRTKRAMLKAERTFKAKVIESQIEARNIRKEFSEDELKDIGASIEGIGRIDQPGTTSATIEARMTPKMKAAKVKIQAAFERMRTEVNDHVKDFSTEEDWIKFYQDYLPHFYKGKGGDFTKAAKKLFTNAKTAKQRKLATLSEAVDVGLVPLTQDPTLLMEKWTNHTWRAATIKTFFGELHTMVSEDGQPVVMAAKDAPAHYVDVPHSALTRITGRTIVTRGKKKTLLMESGVRVHPAAEPLITAMSDTGFSHPVTNFIHGAVGLAKRSQISFSAFHHIALTGSAHAQLAEFMKPTRGWVLLFEKDPTTGKRKGIQATFWAGVKMLRVPHRAMDAVQSGLMVGPPEADAHIKQTDKYLDWIVNKANSADKAVFGSIPILGTPAKAGRAFFHKWDDILWAKYHNGLKMFAWNEQVLYSVNHAIKQGIEVTPDMLQVIKEDAAAHINNAFGGQEWANSLFRNPKTQQILQMSLLAPDWTWSNIKVAGESIPAFVKLAKNGGKLSKMTGNEIRQMRYWRNMIPSFFILHAGMQAAVMMAFGTEEEKENEMWIWDNPRSQKWHVNVTPLMRKLRETPGWEEVFGEVPEGEQTFIHTGKQFLEDMGWIEDPLATLTRKSSPAVQVVIEQVAGSTGGPFQMPWARENLDLWDSLWGKEGRAVSVLEKFVPFSFRGNAFALSVPMQKGATEWKTKTAYVKALRVYVDPGFFRKAFDAEMEYEENLENLFPDIFEAAARNNVDGKVQFKKAVMTVAGKLYREFFIAMEDGDHDKMDLQARKLDRLHKGIGGVFRSARARNIDLEDADIIAMQRSFAEAKKNRNK